MLQVHVSQSPVVPDHKDPAYQALCDHDHNEACDRCDLLSETFFLINFFFDKTFLFYLNTYIIYMFYLYFTYNTLLT